jgi:hypothetical protein
MPLQNRVTPFSRIEAVPQRGIFTGNRGILHDEQRRLVTERWRHKNWIICELSYRDWRRTLMSPRKWTELFFLDEAVALAAGHRPCAFCRLPAFRAFAAAWAGAGPLPKAPEIDKALHAERVPTIRGGERPRRQLSGLPTGTMVLLPENPDQSWLVSQGHLFPWTHAGYGTPVAAAEREVFLITPPATVGALARGYRPTLHPTVTRFSELPRSSSTASPARRSS